MARVGCLLAAFVRADHVLDRLDQTVGDFFRVDLEMPVADRLLQLGYARGVDHRRVGEALLDHLQLRGERGELDVGADRRGSGICRRSFAWPSRLLLNRVARDGLDAAVDLHREYLCGDLSATDYDRGPCNLRGCASVSISP